MPELRRDPVGGRWVIIATERAARPQDFHTASRVPKGGFCPFCEGNEDKTPPEVFARRPAGSRPDGPGWSIRIVPNKYPALRMDGECRPIGGGICEGMNGIGAHEVIIETPKHVLSPTELTPDAFEDVVKVYYDRMLELKNDERLAYALIFKNVGEAAGASIEHSHSQLICTPVVPKRVGEEMDRCMDYYRAEGRCLLCAIVEQYAADGERVVINDDEFLVVTPYASRFPFEMWLMPKQHISHFEKTPREILGGLGRVLHEALRRLDVSLAEPPYNYILHTSPFSVGALQHYHWHVEIIPRVTQIAGFEWGTGFYINPVVPERAAQYLRDVAREEVKT